MNRQHNKVLICHYRVGITDGVSLEIKKRQAILHKLNYDTVLMAGPRSKGADYVIDELDFDRPDIAELTDCIFGDVKDDEEALKILDRINALAEETKRAIIPVIEKEKPDYIFLHNILSHGRHIAAAKAWKEIVETYKIPTLGMHHDFWFERPKYAQIKNKVLLNYLNEYVPPVSPYIQHAVINSATKEHLEERRNISARVITDTFDFDQKRWEKDEYNSTLKKELENIGIRDNDIVALQATRIVSRKSIEFAIQTVSMINEKGMLLPHAGETLYNGKKIDKDTKIHLLIVGYAENDGVDYLNELKEFAKDMPYIHFTDNLIFASRQTVGERKCYSLWDSYLYADMVSYPSTFEGWGNQFIEAVFAKLPILCFEYPVFKTDIKPFGYHYVSLGDKYRENPDYRYLKTLPASTVREASEHLLDTITSRKTPSLIEDNFNIGRKFHSYSSLETNMQSVMDSLKKAN